MVMEISLTTLLLLVAVSLVAGFTDAIAGGGGLLTLPALLAVGVPPTAALATNKLQACFGSFSAAYYFWRRKIIDLKAMRGAIICTFIGAALGTLAVQRIDAYLLRHILPFLMVVIALYFLLSPRMSNQDSYRRLGHNAFALVVGTGVGFYDGFFGPGTGSFFAMAFVALAGFGLTKATAHTKLLNFTSNIASLLFFILGGKVMWSIGLAMALGQMVGARLGSRLVLAKGAAVIRPLLIILSLAMSVSVLWQNMS